MRKRKLHLCNSVFLGVHPVVTTFIHMGKTVGFTDEVNHSKDVYVLIVVAAVNTEGASATNDRYKTVAWN